MSSSAIQYQQVGASETGIGVSGSYGASVAKEGGVALAQGATLKTGLDVIGSNVNGGLTIGETGLGQKFADTIRDITERNVSALSSIVNNQSSAGLPNAATDLPKPTDEKSDGIPQKAWLIGGAIVVGLLALFFMRRGFK